MIQALRDLQAFRRDAVAFFQTHDMRDGHARVDLRLRTVHVVASAPLAQEMLTHPRMVRGGKPYGPLGTFAGQGSLRALLGPTLPTLDGDAGRKRRALLRPIYVDVARRLRRQELAHADWTHIPPGTHDLYLIVSRTVFALLCETLFGAAYQAHADVVSRTIRIATDALDRVSKSFRPYGVHAGADARTLKETRSLLRALAAEILADLPSRPDAPMHALLDSELTREERLDEIVTTLVAGLETTTLTCCWSIVASLRGGHQNALRDATWRTWCVRETLRQYPAFWTMIRVADADLEIAGHEIARRDVAFISPLLIHHNPEYWDRPDIFDPTRHGRPRAKRPADYLPFGFGARACIGGQLSTAIAERVLEAFAALPHARFLPQEPQGPTPDPKIIVLKSRTGFLIMV